MRARTRLALTLVCATVLALASMFHHQLSAIAAGGGGALGFGAKLERRDPNAGIKHFWEVRTWGKKKIPQGAYAKAKRQWDARPKAATYSSTPVNLPKANGKGARPVALRRPRTSARRSSVRSRAFTA